MWPIPLLDGAFLPTSPFPVAVPGLGPVLVLLTFGVLVGILWVMGAGLRASRRRVECPVDHTACDVVTDGNGRLVDCTPPPSTRGVHCSAQCLAA